MTECTFITVLTLITVLKKSLETTTNNSQKGDTMSTGVVEQVWLSDLSMNLINRCHCLPWHDQLINWSLGKTYTLYIYYSRPPNTADLGTDEKAAVFGNRRYWESYITYKTLIWDLEMGGGIGGTYINLYIIRCDMSGNKSKAWHCIMSVKL